jgi:hypothetical protein
LPIPQIELVPSSILHISLQNQARLESIPFQTFLLVNVAVKNEKKYPCSRRPQYTTIAQKFDAICDIDNEVCREVFEDDIGNFIRISEQAEPAVVPAAEAPPQVAQRIINDLINSLRPKSYQLNKQIHSTL